MADPFGLLLATMEPSPDTADEFQQWYDTEHFPERQSAPGFLTAARYVCIDGWPRYLALYDLANVEVLHGPDYEKMTKGSTSRWAGWIMPHVTGLLRAEGIQVYPGKARLGEAGESVRLAVWRFRDAPATAEAAIIAGLRGAYEALPDTVQLRVFRVEWAEGIDFVGIVELAAGADLRAPAAALTGLGNARRYVDLYNVYSRYWRSYPRTTLARMPRGA